MTKGNNQITLIAGMTACGLLAGYWAYSAIITQYTIRSGQAALEKGYPALALARIQSHRDQLAKTKDGCILLVNVYFASRQADSLEWASEACLDAGREIPEAFLGLSASFGLRGLDQQAVQILMAASKRFEANPSFYLKLAQIFSRNKDLEGAAKNYLAAADHAPDNQLVTLEALQYFIETKKNDLASKMAGRLKAAKTDSPEVKLLVSRGLMLGKDEEGSKHLAEEALPLIKDPKILAFLKERYKDVWPEEK